uniref:Uncharacterized protein n=1 Tax=Rangifer tarandus platyrhynchus TaxID=3082113 RepID=A0ACB0E9W1_RANTA|nr:unnamed protein product [Rangifer tarandus platyrhynchus]
MRAPAAPGRPSGFSPAGAGREGREAAIPSPEAFGTSVCIEKTAQEPVPATKRGLLRLSPMTHTTTSTTVGDPEPAETLMLSSLSPQDFCGVADLTSIVQLWKLRLTKSLKWNSSRKRATERRSPAPSPFCHHLHPVAPEAPWLPASLRCALTLEGGLAHLGSPAGSHGPLKPYTIPPHASAQLLLPTHGPGPPFSSCLVLAGNPQAGAGVQHGPCPLGLTVHDRPVKCEIPAEKGGWRDESTVGQGRSQATRGGGGAKASAEDGPHLEDITLAAVFEDGMKGARVDVGTGDETEALLRATGEGGDGLEWREGPRPESLAAWPLGPELGALPLPSALWRRRRHGHCRRHVESPTNIRGFPPSPPTSPHSNGADPAGGRAGSGAELYAWQRPLRPLIGACCPIGDLRAENAKPGLENLERVRVGWLQAHLDS